MIFCSFMLDETGDNQGAIHSWLEQFLDTETGQWLHDHCPNLSYTVTNDPEYWGYKIVVFGDLSDSDATYYTLKYK